MKEYSKLPRSQELKSHHRMELFVTPSIPLLGEVLPLSRGYCQCIQSTARWTLRLRGLETDAKSQIQSKTFLMIALTILESLIKIERKMAEQSTDGRTDEKIFY